MKRKEVKVVHETKWLSFNEATYLDKNNEPHQWSYVSRKKSDGVVTMICRSRYNRYLFIIQPRVPVNKKVLEFPAGLIDKGETPEQAALRELREETGYEGMIKSVGPAVPKSAGLSDETHYVVELYINEKFRSEQDLEPSEEIEVLWKTPYQIKELIDEWTEDKEKILISSDVWLFLRGYFAAKKK